MSDVVACGGVWCVDAAGKDTNLRDYAQGCWRLRGLGRGMTAVVYVSDEVAKSVAAVARGDDPRVNLVAWLCKNSIDSNKIQVRHWLRRVLLLLLLMLTWLLLLLCSALLCCTLTISCVMASCCSSCNSAARRWTTHGAAAHCRTFWPAKSALASLHWSRWSRRSRSRSRA